MTERRHLDSDRAREIGRLGKQASPWRKNPACASHTANASFKTHNRLQLIKAAAQKTKEKPDGPSEG